VSVTIGVYSPAGDAATSRRVGADGFEPPTARV
jgi:hypothetical protein